MFCSTRRDISSIFRIAAISIGLTVWSATQCDQAQAQASAYTYGSIQSFGGAQSAVKYSNAVSSASKSNVFAPPSGGGPGGGFTGSGSCGDPHGPDPTPDPPEPDPPTPIPPGGGQAGGNFACGGGIVYRPNDGGVCGTSSVFCTQEWCDEAAASAAPYTSFPLLFSNPSFDFDAAAASGLNGVPYDGGTSGNGSLIDGFGLDYMHWGDDIIALTKNDLGVRRVLRPRHVGATSFGPLNYANWDMRLELTAGNDNVIFTDITVRDPLSQIPYKLAHRGDANNPIEADTGLFDAYVAGTAKSTQIGNYDAATYDQADWGYKQDIANVTSSNFFLPRSTCRNCVMENWLGVKFHFELLWMPDEETWDEVVDEQLIINNGYPGHTNDDLDTYLDARLVKTEYPDGRVTNISYKTWTPEDIYNSWERLFQIDTITSNSGETLTFAYGAQQVSGMWVVSSITNSDGQSATYTYTGGNLTSVSRGIGTSSSFTHGFDSASNSATVEIEDLAAAPGHRKKTIYLSTYVTGSGWFGSSINLIRIVKNPLDEVNYAAVQIEDTSKPVGERVSTYTYLGGGRMKRLVPAGDLDINNNSGGYWRLGAQLQQGWDMSVNSSNEVEITGDEDDAGAHQSSDAMETLGNLYESSIDPSGHAHFHSYENGWLKRMWYTDDTFETWCRDNDGRLTRYRDRDGNVIEMEYGASGSLTKKKVGLTDHSSNVETADPYSGSPTYDHCASNDVQSADYAEYEWNYDSNYNNSGEEKLTSYVDPMGNQTDYTYDANGFLTEIKQPADTSGGTRPTTTFTYHPNGQTKTVTDPDGNVKEFFYDAQFRLISTLYDDGTSSRIEYGTGTNGYGLPSKAIDRGGVVTTFTYDAADRITEKVTAAAINDGTNETATPEIAQTETWLYLPGTSDAYEYRNNTTVTNYKYDHAGRRVETTVRPQAGTDLTSKSTYIQDKLFSTEDAYGRKTYYAYEVNDGRMIRTIAGMTPEYAIPTTDSQNSSYDPFSEVMSKSRDSQANASYIITDIVYDDEGRLSEVTDGRGVKTKFEYDQRGRQTAVIAAATSTVEARTETDYDDGSRVTAVREPRYFDATDAKGYQKARESWTYNNRGLVASHSEAIGTPEAATESFVYDLRGRMTERTDFAGKVWKTHYEECCGQVIASENPLGHGAITRKNSRGLTVHTVAIADYSSHTTALDDPVNSKTYREVTTRYDGRSRPIASTTWLVARGVVDAEDPPIAGTNGVASSDGLTTQYLYDDNLTDNVGLDNSSGVTPLVGSTSLSLSTALSKLADTEANGGAATTFDADSSGSAQVVIGPGGNVRFSISDSVGRTVITGMLKPSDSSLLSWSCSNYGDTQNVTGYGTTLVSKNVDALGNIRKSFTDAGGRTIQRHDALGKVTSYEYDASGNQLKFRDPNNVGNDCLYDELGRDTSCTDTANHATSNVFDRAGNRITSTDAKNKSTSFSFDARGRQVSTTDRVSGATTFAYSANGQLLSLTDAENQVTSYSYDDAGKKLTETYPDHTGGTPGQSTYGIVTFTRDPIGRTLRRQDQMGDTVTYNYDLAGRMTAKDYRIAANSPSGTIADTDAFTYDEGGRVLTAVSGRYGNTVTNTYDEAGRKTTESLTIAGQTYLTTTTYDSVGRLSGYTYPDGTSVTRNHTGRGELASIAVDGTTIDTRTYDDGGRMLTSVYNNGISESRSYNNDNTVAAITHAGAAIGDYSYGWDNNKNKTSEGIAGTMSGYGFDVGTSGYDDEDRLVNWQRSDTSLDQSWVLTKVGDWTSVTENGSTQSRTHGLTHEILTSAAQAVSHDVNGNTTSIPAVLRSGSNPLAMTWDFDNRMVSADVDNDSVADVSYQFDALGRRVSRNDGTTTTVFVQNGQQTVADYTSGTAAASPTYTYVWGSYIDEPVTRNGIGGRRYFHRGHQHSITALTDSAGAILERYAYSAYGGLTITDASGAVRTISSEGNRYTYTGREWDGVLEEYHFRARMYDPIMGRFLSRDPIGYQDGMSLYTNYFSLSGVDPTGLGREWPEWHHFYPQAGEAYFAGLGIQCHDPKNGCLLWGTDHAKIHPGWQNELNAKIDQFRDLNGRDPSSGTIAKWVTELKNKYSDILKKGRACPPCDYQTWVRTPTGGKRRYWDAAGQLPGLKKRVGILKRRSGRNRAGKIDSAFGALSAIASGTALWGACSAGNCDSEIDALVQSGKALDGAEINGSPGGYFKCLDYFSAWSKVLTCLGGSGDSANALGGYMCGNLYGGL